MLKDSIFEFYSSGGKEGQDLGYGKIYNEQYFNKIMGIVNSNHGGEVKTDIYADVENLNIHPIVILNPKHDSELVNERIRGPVLPILEYESSEEMQNMLNKRESVEDLFYFSQNTRT